MRKSIVSHYQNEPRVYKVLRDWNDVPVLECDSGTILHRSRHDEKKDVFVACTQFYCYLFKRKHFKLYGRWPLKQLSVNCFDGTLVIELDEELTELERLRHPDEIGKVINEETKEIYDPSKINLELNTLGGTRSELMDFTSEVMRLIEKAKDITEKEKEIPQLSSLSGGGRRGRRRRRSGSLGSSSHHHDDDADDGSSSYNGGGGSEADDESETEEDSSSDDDDGAAAAQNLKKTRGRHAKANAAASKTSKLAQDTQRYVVISSLVDGEFADYAAVKDAYSSGSQKKLLADLELFISDNQRHIQELCHRYYSRFLHAGDECASIDDGKVSQLQNQLQQSTRGIQEVGYKLRGSAAQLKEATIVEERLKATQDLLFRMKKPVELLVLAEEQFKKNQLLNSVTTLSLVEEAAAPLVETSLGQFILHERIPSLTAEIVTLGMQQVNHWCKVLRDNAAVIGKAAMKSSGAADGVGAGTDGTISSDPSAGTVTGLDRMQTKSVEVLPNGKWTIRVDTSKTLPPDFLYSIQTGGPFISVITEVGEVSAGSGIQSLMNSCGREAGEAFVQNVRLSRDRQLSLELENKKLPLEELCCRCLGYMIVEDVVFHVMSPPVTTESILHQQWSRIVKEVATRAVMQCSMEPDVQVAKKTLLILRKFMEQAQSAVHCVELSPGALHSAVDSLRSKLHADLLGQAQMKLNEVCFSDQLQPLSIISVQDYTNNVGRLNLHRAPDLIAVPAAPLDNASAAAVSTTLPYSSMIPAIGFTLLDFVTECYSVVQCSGQGGLNNIDPMILKYLENLVKTCTDLLKARVDMLGSDVFHFAVLCSCLNAFLVVLSTVEQRYVQLWDGILEGEYTFGKPALLLDATKNVKKVYDLALGRAVDSVVIHLRQLCQPGVDPSYWIGLSGNPADVSVLGTACDYLLGTLPSLAVVWTPTAVLSLATSVLFQLAEIFVEIIESAIKRSGRGGQHNSSGDGDPNTGGPNSDPNTLYEEAHTVAAGNMKDIKLLREALTQYEARALGPGVQGFLGKLKEAAETVIRNYKTSIGVSSSSAAITAIAQKEQEALLKALRFSFEPAPVVDRLRRWIEAREVEIAEEAARQLQIAADLQAAGEAVIGGVKDVGKATGKGVRWFGRGVKKVATATASTAAGVVGTGGDKAAGGGTSRAEAPVAFVTSQTGQQLPK